MDKPKKYSQEQRDSLYWRYKKNVVPKDEFKRMNGPVKIIKKSYKQQNRGKTPYTSQRVRQIMKEED